MQFFIRLNLLEWPIRCDEIDIHGKHCIFLKLDGAESDLNIEQPYLNEFNIVNAKVLCDSTIYFFIIEPELGRFELALFSYKLNRTFAIQVFFSIFRAFPSFSASTALG